MVVPSSEVLLKRGKSILIHLRNYPFYSIHMGFHLTVYQVEIFHIRLSDLLKVIVTICRKVIPRILTIWFKGKTLSRRHCNLLSRSLFLSSIVFFKCVEPVYFETFYNCQRVFLTCKIGISGDLLKSSGDRMTCCRIENRQCRATRPKAGLPLSSCGLALWVLQHP